ncbi:HipA domain-containing protein, partial [Acinetobacter baumannii]
KVPGSLDYRNFLRATLMCTQDVRERLHTFKRAVFNELFNNRDDHTKHFSFLMAKNGQWKLAPAYDVTFCEGLGGYDQMDIVEEALNISRNDIHKLGTSEANLTTLEVDEIILAMREIALQFSQIAQRLYPHQIRESTLEMIQSRIQQNIDFLTET